MLNKVAFGASRLTTLNLRTYAKKRQYKKLSENTKIYNVVLELCMKSRSARISIYRRSDKCPRRLTEKCEERKIDKHLYDYFIIIFLS